MRLKKILIIGIISISILSCGKDQYHDSGLANGKHNCTVWEYLQQDNQNNWDSVVVMIRRAGVQDVFDGSNPQYPEITFFGPVNYSVMQFLYKTENEEGERLYHSIQDIPTEICRQMVLSHILLRRMMKEEFDYEIKGTDTGGTIMQTLTGIDLRVYRIKTPYNGIPDIGPEYLAIHALEKGHKSDVASADIECTNGVVHSLSNTYEMVEL